MLKSLNIASFKSFNNLDLFLFPLTVLTGLNSSGKSSIIQAIRMCAESLETKRYYLRGHGGYDELKSKYSLLDSSIYIELINCEGKKYAITLTKDNCENSDNSMKAFDFDYIAADRLGPSSSLPILASDLPLMTIGSKGEYCVDYYLMSENAKIPDFLHHENSKGNTVKHQLSYWMNEISPGVKLDFSKEPKHDVSHIEIDTFRASNTGFGISYALPIVLSALVFSAHSENKKKLKDAGEHDFNEGITDSPLLLIENPEAHLHPRGQTAMGYLLAKAAVCGTQIVVETHSDHFIDGVRIAMKEHAEINESDIGVYFFSKDKDSESKVELISVKKNGRLDKWPEGFFDQAMLNLKTLAK
ncbi:AAA family ATPase [Hafnia paralvei]|uniref:AAA family ATPase n=1 Tax=Hafnia paralvei TaxID=546367 RepID=UPI00141A13B0|nr:DUF3696 domain-containing protein [Hafnia paralvei]NIH30671.1 DUF3696 domain-containing protein [Hafnia paralvei]